MIRKFDEEFPDLMVFKDSPARPAAPTEYDDSNYKEKPFDNMTLFLLAQQKEPDFIEGYCLRDNNKIRLQAIRETIEQKPKLLENIRVALEAYLPISYEQFMKLNFFDKENMLDLVKSNMSDEERHDFNKLFNALTPDMTIKLTNE